MGKVGQEIGGEGTEAVDVCRVDGFVEANVFDGRADDGSACVGTGGSRDDVDLGCAENEVQRERRGQGDGEHLALARCDGEMRGRDGCGRPGSGAVDELCGVNRVSRSVDFDDVIGDGSDEADWTVGAEVDGGGADGGQECRCEFAGIKAVFVEESEVLIARVELRQEMGEFFRGEEVGLGVGFYGLQGDVGVKGDLVA